jgi:hypothetical protein
MASSQQLKNNSKSASLTTKENFKQKLKAMRLRIKKKREEFLKFTLLNKSTESPSSADDYENSSNDGDYMMIIENDIKPEIEAFSLFEGLNTRPLKKQKSLRKIQSSSKKVKTTYKKPRKESKKLDQSIISIDVSFDFKNNKTKSANSAISNSKSPLSRTSTPIFNKRNKSRIVFNSNKIINNSISLATKKGLKRKCCSPPSQLPKSSILFSSHSTTATKNRFISMEQNNFLNYNSSCCISPRNSNRFSSFRNDQQAIIEQKLSEFQDFGEIKVWYV